MPSLTALKVKSAKPGRHGDGAGLYLLVAPTGSRSWMLRVQVDGRRRDVGLGALSDLTLLEARDKAAVLRKAARAGRDPVAERDKDRRAPPTFKAAAIACHAELSKGWAAKGAASFLSTLETHAYPKLGSVRVDHVDASAVRETLASVWTDKPAMARKLRQRIGMVLNFAKSHGWREAETPGRSVTLGLAKQSKPRNFPAMPYADVPAFVTTLLDAQVTMGRLALSFTIFTAARSGEVRSAMWSHFDLKAGLWRRPAQLMKSREEHVVTLNLPALAVLRQAAQLRTTLADALVFPGTGGRQLSDMTLSKALSRHVEGLTVHGFRSSFRDWAAERMPSVPDSVAEAALAHVVGDAVVRAYQRTTFLDMRRKLLAAWGDYLVGIGEDGTQAHRSRGS